MNSDIDASTRLCGLLGNPVEHSLSPAMHNAAFAELGLNFIYLAFRVEDVEHAVKGVRALGLRGVSVTIPHKMAVIPHLNILDKVAAWIGSVNTIVNDDGVLKGYNTDGLGAKRALEQAGVALKGTRMLMLGSGGAARAIAFTLAAEAGIESLTILGIIEDEMEKLARDITTKTHLKVQEKRLTERHLEKEIKRHDLIIHCTPVGMHPDVDKTVVDKKYLRPELTVMDIVYNPKETRLIKEAQSAGCKTVLGFEMLLYQALLQFELWTKKKAPEALMRKVLEEKLAGL